MTRGNTPTAPPPGLTKGQADYLAWRDKCRADSEREREVDSAYLRKHGPQPPARTQPWTFEDIKAEWQADRVDDEGCDGDEGRTGLEEM